MCTICISQNLCVVATLMFPCSYALNNYCTKWKTRSRWINWRNNVYILLKHCLLSCSRISDDLLTLHESDPLADLDQDGRSFMVCLARHTPQLTCGDLRNFLSCTCNLDPQLRKQIRGEKRHHKKKWQWGREEGMGFCTCILGKQLWKQIRDERFKHGQRKGER